MTTATIRPSRASPRPSRPARIRRYARRRLGRTTAPAKMTVATRWRLIAGAIRLGRSMAAFTLAQDGVGAKQRALGPVLAPRRRGRLAAASLTPTGADGSV